MKVMPSMQSNSYDSVALASEKSPSNQPHGTSKGESFTQFAKDNLRQLGEQFQSVVSGLKNIYKSEQKDNLIGGARSVHPSAFEDNIKELQDRVEKFQVEDPKDQDLLNRLQTLLDDLVPKYEQFIGLKTEYPGLEDLKIRYKDASGNAISKKEFDAIVDDFTQTLEKVSDVFKEGLERDFKKGYNSVIDQVQNLFNSLKIS